MHILDAARHMLCVVLLNPVTTTLALFVVSDWEDMSKTALLSTGLSYVSGNSANISWRGFNVT